MSDEKLVLYKVAQLMKRHVLYFVSDLYDLRIKSYEFGPIMPIKANYGNCPSLKFGLLVFFDFIHQN